MKPLPILVACLLHLSIVSNAQTFSHSVHFNTNAHTLESNEQEELTEFLQIFSPQDDLIIHINGHADFRGSDAYNQVLSDRRTASVREFILKQGFTPTELTAKGMGERVPLIFASEDQKLRKNRRVEILIEKRRFESVDEVLAELGKENKWELEINGNKDSFFESDRGSAVYIPAGSFVDAEGNPVEGEVNVSIIEAIDPLDFFSEKLSCISGETLLESGGMMKIEATAPDGTPLMLNEDTPITIGLPNDQLKEDMELFVSEAGDDWTPHGQRPMQFRTVYAGQAPFRVNRQRAKYPKLELPAAPIKPCVFRKPVAPNVPDWSKYDLEFKWYQIFGRNKKRRSAALAKERAQQQFDKKWAKFERKQKRYEESVANHADELVEYENAMVGWLNTCADLKDEYYNVLIPALDAAVDTENDQLDRSYEESVAKWNARKDSLLIAQQEGLASVQKIGFNTVKQYVYEIQDLGWINCDRFMKYPQKELDQIVVRGGTNPECQTVLSFTNMNTMLPFNRSTEGWTSPLVPFNEEAIILSFYVEDGDILFAKAPAEFEEDIVLEYEKVSITQLRTEIQYPNMDLLGMK